MINFMITNTRYYVCVMLTISLTFIAGCYFSTEEKGIERDEKERKEILDGLFVTYWKGAKLSVRSMPIDGETESIDFSKISEQQSKDLNLGKHLTRIYNWESVFTESEDTHEPLSAREFIELAEEIYNLADTIKDLEEDDYPTFAEVLYHTSRVLNDEPIEIPEDWNDAMDHWLFALVMETRFGFGSWKTYELNKVQPQTLVTSDYRIIANLHQGIDHLRNEWYYLADQSFSQAIEETNNSRITLQESTKDLLNKATMKNIPPDEKFRLGFRAGSHLLRGFSRHQADSDLLNEKALEDIESAIDDFRELGIDNELVWMAESYFYIRKEEKEKSVASLTKLRDSKFITTKERDLISQAIERINERDPESALNFLTDKVIIYRLGLSYSVSYANEIQWMQLLEKTDQGKKILNRFTELEQTLEKAKAYLNLDSLKDRSKDLFDSLVN